MSRFALGDAYYGPLRRADLIPHHWFIISSADSVTGELVCVSMTDLANSLGDENCILRKGEYPRITKDSVIRYEDAVVQTEADLQRGEAAGILEKRQPIPSGLLMKIRDGALASDATRRRIKELVRRN